MNIQPRIFPVAEADLPAVAELAGVIWRAVYPGIISGEQIEFMLAGMYSLDRLRAEIRSQGIRYYRLVVDGQLAGFGSIGPTASPEVWKLHKLYLRPEMHRRGLGGFLLRHCEAEAGSSGARRLILTVNKHNHKAIAFYQRNGFTVAESVVTDIGGGFVMDDFILTKDLPGDRRQDDLKRQR